MTENRYDWDEQQDTEKEGRCNDSLEDYAEDC